MQDVKMKPIWYFVGLLLMVMGVIVLAAGIKEWLAPGIGKTVFAHIYPGIWWGGIMLCAGALFFFISRKRSA